MYPTIFVRKIAEYMSFQNVAAALIGIISIHDIIEYFITPAREVIMWDNE